MLFSGYVQFQNFNRGYVMLQGGGASLLEHGPKNRNTADQIVR
jgi:hypothetical protein